MSFLTFNFSKISFIAFFANSSDFAKIFSGDNFGGSFLSIALINSETLHKALGCVTVVLKNVSFVLTLLIK
jgi:hypothetical protein